MLCVPIVGPTLPEIERQVTLALSQPMVRLIEYRFDLFKDGALTAIPPSNHTQRLFTLRSVDHGGQSAAVRKVALTHLMKQEPEWLDLEWEHDLPLVPGLKTLSPKTRVLLSYHSQRFDLAHIEKIIKEMSSYPVDGIKIAVRTETAAEALQLAAIPLPGAFTLKALIPMGEAGSSVRLLAPVTGQTLFFAALGLALQSAPGQINAADWIETYRLNAMQQTTKPFALIGNPVHLSQSHRTHNSVFEALGLDALYIKCALKEADLKIALEQFKKFHFGGLSVTMPFKETIIPFLDEVVGSAKAAGAVNTVVFREGKAFGYNTDGLGALQSLQKHLQVKGKTALIIGAGGTAKAIAYTLLQEGVHVIMANRTHERLLPFTEKFNIAAHPSTDLQTLLQQAPDIVINATSVGMAPQDQEMPFDPSWLQPQTNVLDVVSKPHPTLLVQAAAKRGCTAIPGREMFIEQALHQFKLWFGPSTDTSTAESVMRQSLT